MRGCYARAVAAPPLPAPSTSLAIALVATLALPAAAPALEIASLELLGEAVIDSGRTFEETLVGGLSGIVRDPERRLYYAVSDDPSGRSPARFYSLRIDLSGGRLEPDGVEIVDVTLLRDASRRLHRQLVMDAEGIALTPRRTLLISSEGNVERNVAPSIRELDLEGHELRELEVPERFLPRWGHPVGVRHNQVFEPLTMSTDGGAFFTGTENAIHQDGPPADIEQPSLVRLLRYDLESGRATHEYAYRVEPVASPPVVPGGFRINGLVELLVTSPSTLLALERSYSIGVGNTIRLFEVDLEGADDVRGVDHLHRAEPEVRRVSKRLLVDLGVFDVRLDNLEGMTFGPDLPDGRRTLILVSDNNFSERQVTQILAFAIGTGAEPAGIPQIQGTGHRSPFAGLWLRGIEGVVTGTLGGDAPGFWLQDAAGDGDPATSDAVFVDTGRIEEAPEVRAGDALRVDGRVVESAAPGELPLTRLVATGLEILGRGGPLPEAVPVGAGGRVPPARIDDDGATSFDPGDDGLDFWESLEGMRIELLEPVVVGPTTRFASFAVAPGGLIRSARTWRGGVLVGPEAAGAEVVEVDLRALRSGGGVPQLAVGERFAGPLVGVVDYAFGAFRISATEPLGTVTGEIPPPESSGLGTEPGGLTLATYNVENLDPGDPAEKLNRLAADLVDRLGAPAVVALQEIQDDSGNRDDGTVTAAENLARLGSAIVDAGGPLYEARWIDPENNADGGAPGANIRVAYLVDPERAIVLDRRGEDGGGEDSTGVVAVDGDVRLTRSPGRLGVDDPAFAEDRALGFAGTRKPLALEILSGGRRLFLVNVHLKSKRGDDPLFGARQPPRRPTGQQREQQAHAVAGLVAEILGHDPDAAVAVLGDFNDDELSRPLELLLDAGLVNLIEAVPASERYTYNYRGRSQVLDHVLVSPALARRSPAVDVVHLNADFPAARRSSDHDPVVVRIDLDD